MLSPLPRDAEWPQDPVGAAWLARHFDVYPFGRLPMASQIGGRRVSRLIDGRSLETYPESMRPDDTLAGHLQFHLRHETPHLEFLSRLFERTGPEAIQRWMATEPTGQYARRAAFLYEWLTGDTLEVPPRLGGNYVDAIDDKKLIAASPEKAVKVKRWRVNDNLPGTRHFCPIVTKSDKVVFAASLNVRDLLDDLADEFGDDLLMRAAVWMTLRESKASFAIEGESDQTNRIQRFADVMAKRTGYGPTPLTHNLLADLQRKILGERSTLKHFGIRKSPVFVGEVIRYQEIVHYVAPPADDLEAMLTGLQTFLDRTQGQSSVMRSAIVAFGFVYIHPLADGNGRVHRFLVNDILRRDGAIPDPVILPISATLTESRHERQAYNQVLDRVSGPLMQAVRDFVVFEPERTRYADGVVSNFTFLGAERSRHLWRYPDLSPHVVFMADIIERTVTEHMREESLYLRGHARAREALKEIVEMPDHQADRVLRSIEQHRGALSNALAKEIPILKQDGVWDEIVSAVSMAFELKGEADPHVVEGYRPGRPR